MKTGISLQDLARKLEENRDAKKDFITDTRAARVEFVDGKFNINMQQQGIFPLQSHPLRQIAQRADIPAKYMERMRAEIPELLVTNVNAWFDKSPEKRMVRTLRGEARAFLSNKYQRIENDRIAEVALPALLEFPGVQVISSEVTDSRLYLQAVLPSVQGEVVAKGSRKVGDVMQAGVIIQNSEVGLGAVDVMDLDYRLRCLNGMVGESLFRRAHIGRKVEDTDDLEWADDTRKADDEALMLKIRDMVKNALDAARFHARLDKMNGLAAVELADPVKAIELLPAILPITEGERGGILKSLIAGGDLSAWGLLNAVTHQAHAVESYDRSVELEQMGGKLLNLPGTEWKRVLEAA
jgi:hypothetical protein